MRNIIDSFFPALGEGLITYIIHAALSNLIQENIIMIQDRLLDLRLDA